MLTFLQWFSESKYVLNKNAHWGIVVPVKNKEGYKMIRGDQHKTATNHDHLSQEHCGLKTDDMLKKFPGSVRYVSQHNMEGKRELDLELSSHPQSRKIARSLIGHPKHNSPEGAFGAYPRHYHVEYKDSGKHYETPEFEDNPEKGVERHLSGFSESVNESKKPKCPHCGASSYSLMPTDFETARCNKCKKEWDHGIVNDINNPFESELKEERFLKEGFFDDRLHDMEHRDNRLMTNYKKTKGPPGSDNHAGFITPSGHYHSVPVGNAIGVHRIMANRLGFKDEEDAINKGHVRYRVMPRGVQGEPELSLSYHRKNLKAVKNAKNFIDTHMSPKHVAYIDSNDEHGFHPSDAIRDPKEAHRFIDQSVTAKNDHS